MFEQFHVKSARPLRLRPACQFPTALSVGIVRWYRFDVFQRVRVFLPYLMGYPFPGASADNSGVMK